MSECVHVIKLSNTEMTSGVCGAKSSRTSDEIKSLWDHSAQSHPLGYISCVMISPITDAKESDSLSNDFGNCIMKLMHEDHNDC